MKFYILRPEGNNRFGTKWAYGRPMEPDIISDEPLDQCPQCGRSIGPLQWLTPHKLKLSSAKPQKWSDIVWGSWLSGLMVSMRFKKIYQQQGLAGIEIFYPQAEVVKFGSKVPHQVPNPHPVYHLTKIVWNGANLDDKASNIVRYPPRYQCSYCRGVGGPKKYDKVVFEKGSWTGADIFVPRGLEGVIVVSQKFKNVAQSRVFTNTLFIPAEKYAYDEHHA